MSGAEKFFDAITEVREDLLEEALDYRFTKRKAIPWQRYAGLAACLALVVCIGYLAANLRMGGMVAAAGNSTGSGNGTVTDGADAGGDTADGAAPEDSDTTGDSAMPPPNDAGGAGESGAAIGSAVPALYLAEAVEGITAERTLTLEFAPDGTVYATDVYTLANAGTEPVTVALAFDDAAASCTVDGVSVEDGAHVSLLKAGASAEIVLRSKAAVEGDTLALDSPVNLTVAEASLVLQNLPEGTVVSGTEPFDRIVQE